MVEIQVAYDGDLRCTARHVPSGQFLRTDAPTDNQGKGELFSPTDLVATGLGTCILTVMGIVARRHGIDMAGAAATVQKEMAAAPLRRLGRLVVDIHIPAAVAEEDRHRLENAAHTCPVHQSLHPDVKVQMAFHWGE